MAWANCRVLVTGAGGFIGSHLVERLVREGAGVVAFVRYNSRGDIGQLKKLPETTRREIEIVQGDLCDPECVMRAASRCRVIMHLGAMISITYSYVNPREVIETNVMGTLNVLMAARAVAGIERVIHTSTSEVYGTSRYAPMDEDHPLQGQSPYSASKIGADKIVESFFRSFDVPVVTIRPFNTYGPRQSTRAIIPTIITQALTQPTVKLGDLRPTRDLTFVEDTVTGFMRAGEASSAILGETINLGTGVETSVGDLVETVFEILGARKPLVTEEIRIRPTKSEVYRLIAANRTAADSLGWRPQHTLRQGLEKTIEWIRAHIEDYDSASYQV